MTRRPLRGPAATTETVRVHAPDAVAAARLAQRLVGSVRCGLTERNGRWLVDVRVVDGSRLTTAAALEQLRQWAGENGISEVRVDVDGHPLTIGLAETRPPLRARAGGHP
jgi:hypothetical protein